MGSNNEDGIGALVANFSTYSGIIDTVTKWCNRTAGDVEFLAQIPTAIRLAELQINMDVPTLGNQKYVQSTLITDVALYTKPLMWGRTLSISVNYVENGDKKTTFLNRISPETITEVSRVNALPMYYTDMGSDLFLVSPTPDHTYTFYMAYYELILPLSLTNAQNWVSTNEPDLLFANVMSKMCLYLGDSDGANMWDTIYKERMEAINRYDQERLVDRKTNVTTKALSPHITSAVILQ